MTIEGLSIPDLNAAQEVKPMNGGISHRSTETFTSVRGEETLNTPSSGCSLPFSPVICSIRLVSRFLSAAKTPAAKAQSNIPIILFFINALFNVDEIRITLHCLYCK